MRTRGRVRAVLLAAPLSATLLVACGSGTVEVTVPPLEDEDAAACAALLDSLPEELAGLERTEVAPADAPARAWGDGLALTCGVEEPASFRELITPTCDEIVGVGWFFPPQQLEDEDGPVTGTTIGYRPRVQVQVPEEYRGGTSFAALSALAAPVEEHLELVQRCQ